MGPPRDQAEAVAVLRAAAEPGITPVDTSGYYGPRVTDEIIREALAPHPEDVHLVTEVRARRTEDGGWPPARGPEELRTQVHGDLETLGPEALGVVDLRSGGMSFPEPGPPAESFGALAELRQQGSIRHLGVSTVSAEQLVEAQVIAPVVCVQNTDEIAPREDDALVAATAAQGITFVPSSPLRGSPKVLLIPGTSSVAHLRVDIVGTGLQLPVEVVAELDAVSA